MMSVHMEYGHTLFLVFRTLFYPKGHCDFRCCATPHKIRPDYRNSARYSKQ